MVDVQGLLRKGINNIYVEVSSTENVQALISTLIKIKFFTNLNGWLGRNEYKTSRGEMKYLVLNLKTKEVAFNRDHPTEELLKTKLFVNEMDNFVNAGPKKKLLF
jgi:hypothetical protein